MVFDCLAQAICLIIPAAFIKISWLLTSVQFKPTLRRAEFSLPELFLECLRSVCLCWQQKYLANSVVLVILGFPAQAEKGLDFISGSYPLAIPSQSYPVVTAWIGIVYILPPSLAEKHFWKTNPWFWKLRIKGAELLNNLSSYKMYAAMHVLTCFGEYHNLLSLELNIDTDKAASIFISQVNTFLYSPQHPSICGYYYDDVCPSAEGSCMWAIKGKRSFILIFFSYFNLHEMLCPGHGAHCRPHSNKTLIDGCDTLRRVQDRAIDFREMWS